MSETDNNQNQTNTNTEQTQTETKQTVRTEETYIDIDQIDPRIAPPTVDNNPASESLPFLKPRTTENEQASKIIKEAMQGSNKAFEELSNSNKATAEKTVDSIEKIVNDNAKTQDQIKSRLQEIAEQRAELVNKDTDKGYSNVGFIRTHLDKMFESNIFANKRLEEWITKWVARPLTSVVTAPYKAGEFAVDQIKKTEKGKELIDKIPITRTKTKLEMLDKEEADLKTMLKGSDSNDKDIDENSPLLAKTYENTEQIKNNQQQPKDPFVKKSNDQNAQPLEASPQKSKSVIIKDEEFREESAKTQKSLLFTSKANLTALKNLPNKIGRGIGTAMRVLLSPVGLALMTFIGGATISKIIWDNRKAILDWAQDKLIGLWEKAVDKIGQWMTDIGNWFKQVGESITEGIKNWYENSSFKVLVDGINEWFGFGKDRPDPLNPAPDGDRAFADPSIWEYDSTKPIAPTGDMDYSMYDNGYRTELQKREQAKLYKMLQTPDGIFTSPEMSRNIASSNTVVNNVFTNSTNVTVAQPYGVD